MQCGGYCVVPKSPFGPCLLKDITIMLMPDMWRGGGLREPRAEQHVSGVRGLVSIIARCCGDRHGSQ